MATRDLALSVEGDRVQIPWRAMEHQGFRSWATSPARPEDLRVAFVDGEVLVEMSPEEVETHNKVKLKVSAVLSQIVDDEGLGEVFADGVLLTNTGAGLSTEPDLIFASWETFAAGRARLVEKAGRDDRFVEIEGIPDLVVEIVSDSSVRKDTQLLREAYARAGVSEYWVIDARGSEISFEILQLIGGAYRASSPAGGAQVSPTFGRSWRLSRSRNRAGRFSYRLTAE